MNQETESRKYGIPGLQELKTGYVKPVMMTLLTSQYVPMVAIAESKFLSFPLLAS